MPALHTAFRLVLDSQRAGPTPPRSGLAAGGSAGDPRGEAAAEADAEPAPSSSDRPERAVTH